MTSEPSKWGPAYWRFIHYFSVGAPSCHALMAETINHIPCEECKSEWIPPDSRVNLLQWSVALHNKVNLKLGTYSDWSTIDFGIIHKNTCDTCTDKSSAFPWSFIHFVAKNNHPSAIDFLRLFSDLYPCDKCRGKFFFDTPLVGESVLDWTMRNHLVHDPLYVNKIDSNVCPTCPNGVFPTP